MSQHFYYFSELQKLAGPNDLFDVRFISTENITVAFNILKAGAAVPEHEHLHETIDYVEEGQLEVEIDGQTRRMLAGMVARIPSHVRHSARAITDCKVVNIFYPVREDFRGM
jgi:quercetin dioxygenase-like cupin family protein